MPASQYMQGQKDLTQCMRSILVDWLIEVAHDDCFSFTVGTLHLAVGYVDRCKSQAPRPTQRQF